MASEVSSEKPKALLVAEVAERIRRARAGGGKLLAVCGPAVIHTGAGPDVADLVRAGWIDVLFAGNGFATHDIESSVLGTSLGVSVREGTGVEGGHANHLRVINEVRRWGSIRAGVERGLLKSGVMYECVAHDVPFVLGGSIRDDGPLPDVITDVVAAQDAMRAHRRRRRRGPDAGVDAARHRRRQHAAGRGRDVLRRHQPGRGHQAGRPGQPPGARAS